jgi:hypothetical protein
MIPSPKRLFFVLRVLNLPARVSRLRPARLVGTLFAVLLSSAFFVSLSYADSFYSRAHAVITNPDGSPNQNVLDFEPSKDSAFAEVTASGPFAHAKAVVFQGAPTEVTAEASAAGCSNAIVCVAAFADASFNDTVTLIDGLAQPGAPIPVVASITPFPLIQVSGVGSQAGIRSDFTFTPPSGLGDDFTCWTEYSVTNNGIVPSIGPCQTLQTTVNFSNGVPTSIGFLLAAGAQPVNGGHAFASDPFLFSLTPVQQGIIIHSAAGINYESTSAVPEPNGLMLFGSGLVCLALFLRLGRRAGKLDVTRAEA